VNQHAHCCFSNLTHISTCELQPLWLKHFGAAAAAAAAADPAVDSVAMLLRILYIKDLRSLQSTIDRILVQVQVSASAVHQGVIRFAAWTACVESCPAELFSNSDWRWCAACAHT
jgi:hypothetical protein